MYTHPRTWFLPAVSPSTNTFRDIALLSAYLISPARGCYRNRYVSSRKFSHCCLEFDILSLHGRLNESSFPVRDCFCHVYSADQSAPRGVQKEGRYVGNKLTHADGTGLLRNVETPRFRAPTLELVESDTIFVGFRV
jgi:hypothetical protein